MAESSPLDDAKADQASVAADKRPFPKHWIVLGLLVVANAAFGAYFNPMGKILDVRDFNVFLIRQMIGGFLITQPILFALWAAFAPQRFYHRFLWALLLCALVAFTQELGAGGNNQFGIGFIMVIQMILFILFTAVFLLLRRFTGWCFKCSQTEIYHDDYQANQFGIKHLLMLTIITAIAFALIRSLLILNYINQLPSLAKVFSAVLTSFAVFIPILIIPWITMSFRANMIKLIVFAIVLLGIIDLAIFFIVQHNVGPNSTILRPFLFTQLGGCLSVLLNTIVLRLCGYRMIRERNTVSSSQTIGQ